MRLEFDPDKRDKTLRERGLDFAKADQVFRGRHFTGADTRAVYNGQRFITAGWLGARLVVLVWAPRGENRRIISMRKANEREQAHYAQYLE